MATKIHHNSLKKAKAHGITLTAEGNEIVAIKDGVRLASHMSGKTALELAIAKLGNTLNTLGVIDAALEKIQNGSAKAKKAKPAKKAKVAVRGMSDEDFDEDGEPTEGEEDTDEGRSIVKGKYKTRYRPFRQTCGDDLAQQIAAHIKVKDEDGKLRIDQDKLIRFAKANDIWDPAYRKLNVGQQRMNIGNRLRAKVRRDGHDVRWA